VRAKGLRLVAGCTAAPQATQPPATWASLTQPQATQALPTQPAATQALPIPNLSSADAHAGAAHGHIGIA